MCPLEQALALVRGSPTAALGGASVKEHLIALASTSSRIVERITRIELGDVGNGSGVEACLRISAIVITAIGPS